MFVSNEAILSKLQHYSDRFPGTPVAALCEALNFMRLLTFLKFGVELFAGDKHHGDVHFFISPSHVYLCSDVTFGL